MMMMTVRCSSGRQAIRSTVQRSSSVHDVRMSRGVSGTEQTSEYIKSIKSSDVIKQETTIS